MCCTRLAGNTEPKNDAKNRHLRTIAQLCVAISLQLRRVSTIGKKLRRHSDCLLHMSSQYGELRPTSLFVYYFLWTALRDCVISAFHGSYFYLIFSSAVGSRMSKIERIKVGRFW